MIPPPSPAAYAAAQERAGSLAMPAGALDRLTELGCWIAACQDTVPPRPLDNVRVVIFAGDHGVAADAVSAYPASITLGMAHGIIGGNAGVSVLARQHGAHVRLVDLGVAADLPPEVSDHKVHRGSRNLRLEDALTAAEAEQALDAGKQIAAAEVATGAQLVVPGDLGIGNTTPAAALVAATYGVDPDLVTGVGTGLDEPGRQHKVAVIGEAIARVGDRAADPMQRLAALGSADIAAATGFMIGAAEAGVPVLIDGLIAAAEAVMAEALAPGAVTWMRAGHRSPEPGLSYALDRLGLEPILDLGMRLGEGSGAVAALPLVRSGVALLGEMTTLAEVS